MERSKWYKDVTAHLNGHIASSGCVDHEGGGHGGTHFAGLKAYAIAVNVAHICGALDSHVEWAH